MIRKIFPKKNPTLIEKKHTEIFETLKKLFGKFNTNNLVNTDAASFQKFIESEIGKEDAKAEGYKEYELEEQRDLSIKFYWGHNHDFKNFQLTGRMNERHLYVTSRFMSFYPSITIDCFRNKKVFDIGCWTGGTTLLLNAMGASVTAIEEVKKYAAMTNYLISSFGQDKNTVAKSLSIYDCNTPDFQNQFDIVFFPGVIYHLSDPVLSLRILYNSLKLNGEILVETAGINSPEDICVFQGAAKIANGSKVNLNRGGWNYFIFSPTSLELMMLQAGFDDVKTNWDYTKNRLYAYGKKKTMKGISKAGLSVKDIA